MIINALPTKCKYIGLSKYFPPHAPQIKKNVRCWEMFPRIARRISQPREVNLMWKWNTFNFIMMICWPGARHAESEMDGIHTIEPLKPQTSLEDRYAGRQLLHRVCAPQGTCRQRERWTPEGSISIMTFNYRTHLMPWLYAFITVCSSLLFIPPHWTNRITICILSFISSLYP